jgi:hypothetical protein
MKPHARADRRHGQSAEHDRRRGQGEQEELANHRRRTLTQLSAAECERWSLRAAARFPRGGALGLKGLRTVGVAPAVLLASLAVFTILEVLDEFGVAVRHQAGVRQFER